MNPNKRYDLILAALLLCASSQARAQMVNLKPFGQAEKQCLEAQTTQQCQTALPTCQRAYDMLTALPSNLKLKQARNRVLSKWVECEYQLGRYSQAESHARTMHALRLRLFGPEHPDVAESMHDLAMTLDAQGKYGEAEMLLRQALALNSKMLDPEHPNVAIILTSLASVLDEQGKYSEAETIFRRAIALHTKLLGPEHPDVAQCLNSLASVLSHQGKQGEAETFHRRALALSTKLLGPEHPNVAASLGNLANVIDDQGRHDEAETLHRRALALNIKLLGHEHPHVATSLDSLASVLSRQGKYDEAETLHRRALALRTKLLGSEHPMITQSLNNLAHTLSSQGKYGEAETIHRQALALRIKLLGPEHPLVTVSLNNLAAVLDSQGRYSEAETIHRQTLSLGTKLVGTEHPNVATSLNNLASVLLAVGAPASAIPYLRQAAQIREKQIRATVSETRMQSLLDDLRKEEDVSYGLLLSPNVEGSGLLALSMALLRKGRVGDAGTAANRVVQGRLDKPEQAKRFAEWQAVRQQREAFLYAGSGTLAAQDYQQRLNDLKQQAELLEHQLVADLPELKTLQLPDLDEIVPKVAARLPRDGVLLEIVWARKYQAGAEHAARRWGEPHYIAMLLFPDQRQVTMDLGLAAAVDPLVRALLAALSSSGSDVTQPAQAVFRQVMEPLLPQLGEHRNLYLSLDGTLNLLPFDALHDGSDYLLGRYRFHYLSSGRDLLRNPVRQATSAPLLIGNPDFGQMDVPSKTEGPQSLYQRLAGLPALPGTQREVEQIAKLLGLHATTQRAAREEVVRAVHAPRLLHIATHGLFLHDIDLPAPPDLDRGMRNAVLPERQRSRPIAASEAERLPGERGAMNRSALVLADALQGLHVNDTARDGLLTADEARSLDLHGTQLVVLSACETGQGELSAGQGIYGLRRAFLMAGAETLVTSLWRVSDEATGELMTRYYQKLLDKERPGDRSGAMVEAMQWMRQRPDRAHPYYWAPFLVIGKDGPLH